MLRCLSKILFAFTFLLAGWNTISGQACVDVAIPSLPFAESGSTCGFGNDQDANNPCFAWFLGGEDIVFSFTTASDECLQIDLSGYTMGSAGIILTSSCPDDMTGTCVGQMFSGWASTSLSLLISPQPNTTYYLTISTDGWTAMCTDYDLSITTACPPSTISDCLGAVPVCDDYFYQEFGPVDGGNYVDIIQANGCLVTTVINEQWYTFEVQADGFLSFTLTPLGADDYDWVLFDMTNITCDEISTDPSAIVSCNTYGLIGVNGPTGISTSQGGTGNANGPGDLAGPPFNADLQVFAGETYALMVSNWTGTTNGFELDLGESTAQFYDDVLPEVEEVYADCSGVHVLFSEYMDCPTAIPANFNITGPGGTYTAVDVQSSCDAGAGFGQHFLVLFDPPFPAEGGDFTLVFEANGLADLCGNFLAPVDVELPVPGGISLSIFSFPAACGNSDGGLEVTVEQGGAAPYQYALNGGNMQNSPTFNNLPVGNYTISVVDAGGCTAEIDGEVVAEGVDFTAGEDGYTCDFTYQTSATMPAGYTGTWTAPASISIANANTPNATFTASVAGIHTLTWTVTNNINCTISDIMQVRFSNLGVDEISYSMLSCDGDCDASATAIGNGAAVASDISYTWSEGSSSDLNPNTVDGLCAGLHSVTLSNSDGCTFDFLFMISAPDPLTIESVSVIPETCPTYCDASIGVESSSAAEYSFDGGMTYGPASQMGERCPGMHLISVKDQHGCTADTSLIIYPATGPTAAFNPEVGRATLDVPTFIFHNNSQDYVNSVWYFNYPETIETSTADEPKYTYPNPEIGEYQVMLFVRDELQCIDSAMHIVSIYEEELCFIPNSFSPNEDGINDIFKPVVRNIHENDYFLRIFDRWGNMVFETYDVTQGWNGSMNGGDYYMDAGVYVYSIRTHSLYVQEPKEWTGSVTLIR